MCTLLVHEGTIWERVRVIWGTSGDDGGTRGNDIETIVNAAVICGNDVGKCECYVKTCRSNVGTTSFLTFWQVSQRNLEFRYLLTLLSAVTGLGEVGMSRDRAFKLVGQIS